MVDQKDEIGFIFVLLIDISKTPAVDESMSLNKSIVAVPLEDSQEKKR